MTALALRDGRLRGWFMLALVIVLCVVFVVSLMLGRYSLNSTDLIQALSSRLGGDPVAARIDAVVYGLRIPRTVLAIFVGSGLALAGAAFQSLFSNPLATPDTSGVTAGASVGAVLAMLLGLPLVGMQLVSLLFGMVAVLVTIMIARHRGRSDIVMLILAGVVVAAIANAVLSLLILTADPNDELPQITYWLMGSLAGANMTATLIGAPLIVLGSVTIIALRARSTSSPWRGRGQGLRHQVHHPGRDHRVGHSHHSLVHLDVRAGGVDRSRIIPHIARMITGSNNSVTVPVCAVLGAIFLVLIDTIARTLLAAEIPISVVTAIVGAPIFIVLLRQTGGRWSS